MKENGRRIYVMEMASKFMKMDQFSMADGKMMRKKERGFLLTRMA